ncbi:MAG: polysaccharide biosynthesis protein, partial [Isosphaeraceae bacterium]|nr:polysaccharide biosynthesis protein [Isosphaeraceae bacterium]
MTRSTASVSSARAQLLEITARCRIPVLVLLHGIAFVAIYLLAHIIRCDGIVPAPLWQAALSNLPLIVGLKLAAFLALGCQWGWWRSASFADLTGLAEAATLGSLALVLTSFLSHGNYPAPRSVLLIDWAGTLLALCGARVSARLLRDRYGPLFRARRLGHVLVIGAGEASEALVREVSARPQLGLKVVGLLDPDRATHGRMLAGARVLGAPGDLARIAARRRVEAVLI